MRLTETSRGFDGRGRVVAIPWMAVILEPGAVDDAMSKE